MPNLNPEELSILNELRREYPHLVNDNREQLVHGVIALKRANLLTTSNRLKLINSESPDHASRTLIKLLKTPSRFAFLFDRLFFLSIGFLGGDFAKAVIYLLQPLSGILLHPGLSPFIYFTVWLSLWIPFVYYVGIKNIFNLHSRSGLLNQDNIDAVLNIQTNPQNLNYALQALVTITQESLDLLIEYELILLTDATEHLWKTIPDKSLTNEHLNEICAICENDALDLPTRENNFIRYMNQIILKFQINDNQIPHAQNRAGLFSGSNGAQSGDNPGAVTLGMAPT